MEKEPIRNVQEKILEIIKFIDGICRTYSIQYFIMGGTALGAVRHGGFIPWDDDLDIFMTPKEYAKFKEAFLNVNSELFVLQEWRTTPKYLEYAKIRMNGTTFIEEHFKERKDIHQGIFVDIMILHKIPENRFIQHRNYFWAKFATLYGLSQRNWQPKNVRQSIALKILKVLPCKSLIKHAYRLIYKYDKLEEKYMYCYWITPTKFKGGLFEKRFFENPVDILFEDTKLMGSKYIKEYLEHRYGDYMTLPSKIAREAAVHAMYYDTKKDYKEYLSDIL